MCLDTTYCNCMQGIQQDKEMMQQLKQQLGTLQNSEAEAKAQLHRNLELEKSSHQQITQLKVRHMLHPNTMLQQGTCLHA